MKTITLFALGLFSSASALRLLNNSRPSDVSLNLVLMEEQIRNQNKINEVRYRERLDDMNLSLHSEIHTLEDNELIMIKDEGAPDASALA
tara:strand:- start:406 stop:675 length:270 start_codon:yes stop_codon:yes gene_type:complete